MRRRACRRVRCACGACLWRGRSAGKARLIPSSPPAAPLPQPDGGGSRPTMKQQQQHPQPQPPQAQPLSAAGGGVPAFLSKLWALVGEAPSNQLITWSQVRQRPARVRGEVGCARPSVRVRVCRPFPPFSGGQHLGPAGAGGAGGPSSGPGPRRAWGGRKNRVRPLGLAGLPSAGLGERHRLPQPLWAVAGFLAREGQSERGRFASNAVL